MVVMGDGVLLVSSLLSVKNKTKQKQKKSIQYIMQIKELCVTADSFQKDVQSLKVPCQYVSTLNISDFYMLKASLVNRKDFY